MLSSTSLLHHTENNTQTKWCISEQIFDYANNNHIIRYYNVACKITTHSKFWWVPQLQKKITWNLDGQSWKYNRPITVVWNQKKQGSQFVACAFLRYFVYEPRVFTGSTWKEWIHFVVVMLSFFWYSDAQMQWGSNALKHQHKETNMMLVGRSWPH